MLPHTANMLIGGKVEQIKKSIKNTMYFMIWLACAGLFGLVGIAPIFSVVFWGQDFDKCSSVITVISISLLFSCFGNVIRTQYLIPKERDKEYTISLIAGAVVNLVVNFSLIGKLGAVGAAVGTIAAEVVLCGYQTWCVRKELEIGYYILRGIPFIIIGTIMAVSLRFVQSMLAFNVPNLIVVIAIGGVIYVVLSIGYLIICKDTMSKEILKMIKNSITNRLKVGTKDIDKK